MYYSACTYGEERLFFTYKAVQNLNTGQLQQCLVVYNFSQSNEHYLCFRPEQKEAKLVALAKEAGFGDDEPPAESTQTVEAKKDVKIMKSQLKVLLQQPVIDPLNSSRFAVYFYSQSTNFFLKLLG